jgi:hypothetical protein
VSVLLKIKGLLLGVFQCCLWNLGWPYSQTACIDTSLATIVLALRSFSYHFIMFSLLLQYTALTIRERKIPLSKSCASMPWGNVGGGGGLGGVNSLLLNISTVWSWVVKVASYPLYPRVYSGTPCLGGWVEPDFVEIQTLFTLMEVNSDYNRGQIIIYPIGTIPTTVPWIRHLI